MGHHLRYPFLLAIDISAAAYLETRRCVGAGVERWRRNGGYQASYGGGGIRRAEINTLPA